MILLDTQALIWTASDPRQLSSAAREVIMEARRNNAGLALADSTLWEVAMAVSRRKVSLPGALSDFLQYMERTFLVLPITAKIAELSVRFSREFPGDPHDRLISATAIVHGLPLVTSDTKIRASGEVLCIW